MMSVQFTVSFSFTQSDITEKKDEASSYDSEYTYEGKLLIKFSVRTTQVNGLFSYYGMHVKSILYLFTLPPVGFKRLISI